MNRKRLTKTLPTAGAVAIGIVLSWSVFSLTRIGHDPTDAHAVSTANEAWICVRASDALEFDETSLMGQLEDVLPELESGHNTVVDHEVERGGLSSSVPFKSPRVTLCEQAMPELPNERQRQYNLGVAEAPGSEIANLLLFVLPDGSLPAGTSRGFEFVRTAYSTSCSQHVCSEKGTAIFITESSFRDEAVLLRALEDGFGWSRILRPTHLTGHPEGERSEK